MKLILIFLIFTNSIFSYPRALDPLYIPKLTGNKVPLVSVLKKLIKHSRYEAIIDPSIQGTTSLSLHRVSVKKALKTLGQLHNLSISYLGRAIVVLPKEKVFPVSKKKRRGKNKRAHRPIKKPSTRAMRPIKQQAQQKALSFEEQIRHLTKKPIKIPRAPKILRPKINNRSQLSNLDEIKLQRIVAEFSPRLKKERALTQATRVTKLLGTSKSGQEYTAIIQYKGESRLCEVGSELEPNVVVQKIFERHLVLLDKNKNKEFFITY
ncbi:hypothetical protein MJH12_10280 [bacterium]|nr:hypothetical protein [bacterium]